MDEGWGFLDNVCGAEELVDMNVQARGYEKAAGEKAAGEMATAS